MLFVIEGRVSQRSVVHFYAVSTLETSLLCVLEVTAGHIVLFSLQARQVPTCCIVLPFVPPGAIHIHPQDVLWMCRVVGGTNNSVRSVLVVENWWPPSSRCSIFRSQFFLARGYLVCLKSYAQRSQPPLYSQTPKPLNSEALWEPQIWYYFCSDCLHWGLL
jgi:hypothetical protein